MDFSCVFPPLFGIQAEIAQTASRLCMEKISSMPSDEVKQLVLDLLSQGRINGLAEALGVEQQIAQSLQASLVALPGRP